MAEVDQALIDELMMLMPGFGVDLVTIFAQEWVDSGNRDLAMASVRQSGAYDITFPGLRREDGSIRMTELEYMGAREAFDSTLLSIGVNPDFFGETFVDMVAGEVSPREMIDRVETVFQSIIQQTPELQAYYASNYGLELTDEAIIASALDPRVGDEILNKRIAVSQIGASAATKGFDLDYSLAERLYGLGTTEAEAMQTFGEAAEAVPMFSALARRHHDPDDDFDINEFTAATLLDDPLERRRMRRLISQERSLFTQKNALTSSQVGVTGLRRL